VRALRAPCWDAVEDFDKIIANKRKDRQELAEARPAVISSCGRYRACVPHVTDFRGEVVDEDQKQALLRCYEAKLRTVGCKKMLAQIRRLNPSPKCPLCGVDSPGTFDHYLPKAEFPALAVCAHNLVPACARCNSARNERWLRDEERSIAHLYYDWIRQDARYLRAEVSMVKNLPRADFSVTSELDSPGFAGLFARHCDSLGLIKLFDGVGSDALLGIAEDLRAYEVPVRHAQRRLRDAADERGRRQGVNHWEVALRYGAAESEPFVRYVFGEVDL